MNPTGRRTGASALCKLLVWTVCLAGCDGRMSRLHLDVADRAGSSSEDAALATPPGITLQPLGKAQGYGLDKQSATLLPREQIVFADANGRTLYMHERDRAGRSECVGECAETWPPAVAPASARAMGDWSVVRRDDGTRQWALRGKPLHTYVRDIDIGSVAGNSPKRYGRGPGIGPRGAVKGGQKVKDEPMPEGWSVAFAYPLTHLLLPAGVRIVEVPDALGLALVDARGGTLYTFEGDPDDEPRCSSMTSCEWRPAAAPQLARSTGDFSFTVRDDGVRQWTWRGRPLYTYAGDMLAGEANGADVDANWRVARVKRYFMPSEVGVLNTPNLGKVLVTAQGQTLYRRDGFIFQSGSGHGLRRGIPVRPAVGRDLGTNPRCADDCSKAWRPLLASEDAQPSGYWDIYTRADGRRQWAYQGYALWTYQGDEKVGDMNANDQYDIAFADVPDRVVDIGTPYDGPTALYWSVAVP